MMALVKKPKNQIFLNTSKNTLMYLLFHKTLLAQFFEKKKNHNFLKVSFLHFLDISLEFSGIFNENIFPKIVKIFIGVL